MITQHSVRKSAAAKCALAFLFFASSAQAQTVQQQRLPTIADCPRGYVLGVQDTASLVPLAKSNPVQLDPNSFTVEGQAAALKAQQQQEATYAANQAQAPHGFVTGCVPAQQLKRR